MTDDQIKAVYQQARWDWGGKGDVDAFFMAFGRALSQEAAQQERERYEELLKAAKFVAFSNGFDAAYPDKLDALRAIVRRSPSTPVQGKP